MRKKDWLKFLRIIFYFLAIISLALSIMGRMAKAESALPDNFWEIFTEDMEKSGYNFDYEYYENFINTNQLYNVLRYDGSTYAVYFFMYGDVLKFPNYGGNLSTQSLYFVNNEAKYTGTTGNTWNYYGKTYLSIVYIDYNGTVNVSYSYGDNWGTWNYVNTTLYDNSSLVGSTSFNYRNYQGNLGTFNYSGIPSSGYFVMSLVCSQPERFATSGLKFANSSNVIYKIGYDWGDVFPVAVSDSRLKFDTIISSGRKELVVDMSLFCDDLLASSFIISDFVLTLEYDGVEQTFDDLGEYISVYASSTGYDCFAIIPYSEFGFDDNNNISDISVSVSNVSFSTNALYPNRPTVTESYNIATSYYLKNDLDNSIDWDDTNVTENPNETIQYDGDDFNDLKISMENPEMQDHGTIYNDWHYVSSLPVWEGWESIYNVDIFTFADAFDVVHTWYHVRADFDSSLVQQFGIYYYVPFKISNWLYDNAISNYYDVLVFKNYHGKYEDVDITAPDDYLIFYSNRYYIKRQILELGNVHKTVSSIGNQIYTLYDFTYKRMNDINGNIQKGFENVLSKDNAIMGLLSSVNFNLDKFGNMINSNLVSVVSGINGLKGSDDRDLTDIYNRLGNMITSVDLTGILTNLFVPTYTGFQDSFDDAIDSMGILSLPFDVSKRFISASRVPYSSTLNVTFPEYGFNNLQYWDEYEFEFNPNSILSADWLEFLQYCNALFVIVTVTLLTYKHIFASPVSEESGIL